MLALANFSKIKLGLEVVLVYWPMRAESSYSCLACSVQEQFLP